MAQTKLSLDVDSELKSRLEREALGSKQSPSHLASKAIRSFLDARDTKREHVSAAIVEADKGKFISSDAVNAWMESWDKDGELPLPEPDVFPEAGSK